MYTSVIVMLIYPLSRMTAMGSPSKPGINNEAGGESPGILPHNVPAGGGQAALANLGNFMSWVKHNTLAVFQPPKRVLSAEEIDLREVSGQEV